MRKVWSVLKWVFGIGLAVLLVCGGAAAFLVPKAQQYYKQQQDRARGTLVVVESAAMGQLTRTVSAPGTISAKVTTNISSRVSAKIESIHFEEGDRVREGDILLELDSVDLVASLNAARARLAADDAGLKSAVANYASEEARIVGSRAAYQNAVAEFERQQSLFSSGDVSQQSLDNARTEVDRTRSVYEAALKSLDAVAANVEAARARVDASRAEVERAQRNVEYCTVRAPFDGLLTRRIAQVGETALGTIQNIGSTLMVLEDFSETQVKARLAETDAPRVSAGQKVRVFVSGYPDRHFNGVLRRVGMTALRWPADNTYYFEAEIVLDTDGILLPSGTTANVEIEIETIANLLVVPSQAVLDKRVDTLPQKLREESPLVDRNKTFAKVVMLKKDGRVVYVPVRAVASSITRTAVAEGLSVGDPVIVGPFTALQNLADGARVRTEDEERKPPGAPADGAEVAEKDRNGARTGARGRANAG